MPPILVYMHMTIHMTIHMIIHMYIYMCIAHAPLQVDDAAYPRRVARRRPLDP